MVFDVLVFYIYDLIVLSFWFDLFLHTHVHRESITRIISPFFLCTLNSSRHGMEACFLVCHTAQFGLALFLSSIVVSGGYPY